MLSQNILLCMYEKKVKNKKIWNFKLVEVEECLWWYSVGETGHHIMYSTTVLGKTSAQTQVKLSWKNNQSALHQMIKTNFLLSFFFLMTGVWLWLAYTRLVS